MIQQFVNRFIAAQPELTKRYREAPPSSYDAIVKDVVTIVSDEDDYDAPDPERIHVIDDGDYQGTRLYIIAAKGYQPSDYWSIFVNYGSCSGCDTFEGICSDYSTYAWDEDLDGPDEQRREEAAKAFVTLALHMVQGMKELR